MIDKKKANEFVRDIDEAKEMLCIAESILDEYNYTETLARTVGSLVEQIRGIALGVDIMQDDWMQENSHAE